MTVLRARWRRTIFDAKQLIYEPFIGELGAEWRDQVHRSVQDNEGFDLWGHQRAGTLFLPHAAQHSCEVLGETGQPGQPKPGDPSRSTP